MLHVKRKGTTHSLHFYVVSSPVTPIPGRASCLGMNLIKILDSDAIYSVQTTVPQDIFLDKILKNSGMFLKVLAHYQGSTPYKLTMTLLQWCTHPVDYQLHCKRLSKKS